MPAAGSTFLAEMLDRLYAALGNGPSLNCRPHASRQRIDVGLLASLGDLSAEAILAALLSDARAVKIVVKLIEGACAAESEEEASAARDTETQRAARQQAQVLAKLRTIAEDARTFAQDTGAHVLHVGYPLLHLPPGQSAPGKGSPKRVLAPIAFIPVHLKLARGRTFTIELRCAGERADRVVPNTALLAWIARQTGQRPAELDADVQGNNPHGEIEGIVSFVCKALALPVTELKADTSLVAAPRADDEEKTQPRIVPAAVLGLFPFSNQSLIDDMEALVGGETPVGPAGKFILVEQAKPQAVEAEPQTAEVTAHAPPAAAPSVADDHIVTAADPCQVQAVRLARQAEILVVHGPPGTGKSQTIANIIGDHLARGQRVLLVCEKRVALDVVRHRLDRLGLGQLCAVVHDAQADQHDLYRAVREQLDGLGEEKIAKAADRKLAAVTRELEGLHQELAEHLQALAETPEPGGLSFHDLVGAWLALPAGDSVATKAADFKEVPLGVGIGSEKAIRDILQRGQAAEFVTNPWADAAGIGLGAFMADSMEHWRDRLGRLRQETHQFDATAIPELPAFPPDGDVIAIGAARAALGSELRALGERAQAERLVHWAGQEPSRVAQAMQALQAHAEALTVLRQGPLDPELWTIHREEPIAAGQLARWLAALDRYLAVARKWYGLFFFGRRRGAAEVLGHFGLGPSAGNAERLRTFLAGVRARLALADLHDTVLAPRPLANRTDDAALRAAVDELESIVTLLRRVDTEPALQALAAQIREALREPDKRESFCRILARAPERAGAIAGIEKNIEATGLFAAQWLAKLRGGIRAGRPLLPTISLLVDFLPKLEGIIRIREALAGLTAPLARAVEGLLHEGRTADDGWQAVQRALLGSEITRRLDARPLLRTLDGDRLAAGFRHYRELEEQRRELTAAQVRGLWLARQQERLLVSTGSRLSSLGAELRRRLLLRGERAMRLRQVIKIGGGIEGGDPLFDLRPVWMAGPATVAELFPRQPLFDLVIFDEASQCRLEEAVPVLLRGKRVVIAGDPRQLPPTRFFESAMARSGDDEPESDQELFEAQQAEVDDLLGAALNLPVAQSYLDVHYRSRCAELIAFSNRYFYGLRLQPIPGHPVLRPEQPPIALHRVAGVYEQRRNLMEAEKVVELVRALLARAEPPSIGIACFNVAQRDAIVDALEEAASEDKKFAERLEEARARQGAGSFEGLFVRNLENVQGDERDCIIISTTYGPDRQGKFYRRFGPLGQAGGGRRLNVLVTRARQEVHVVTSFPAEVYRALPPVPPGSQPNGGWLLCAYLSQVEELQAGLSASKRAAVSAGRVVVQSSATPSRFARALAERLAQQHGLAATVHGGNEGFCIDVVLSDPQHPEQTLGLLTDGSRYRKTDDPVAWDVFRTAMLEAQGWRLLRLWAPQAARDVAAMMEKVVKGCQELAIERNAGKP